METDFRFWIGVLLLLTNQPFGWGAMLLCSALAIKTKRRFFYLLGLGAYALSWGILGLGLWLAGPQGIQYSRNLLKGLWMSRAGKTSVILGTTSLVVLGCLLVQKKLRRKVGQTTPTSFLTKSL